LEAEVQRGRRFVKGSRLLEEKALRIVFRHHAPLEVGGGSERIVIEFATYLAHQGHDVSVKVIPLWNEGSIHAVVADSFAYSKNRALEVGNCDVCYMTSPLDRAFTRVGPRAKVVSGLFTHTMFKVSGMIGKLVSGRSLLPVVSTASYRALSPFILRQIDAIHIPNPYYLGIRHKRKYYVPLFSDSSVFKPTVERLGTFTVLFAGRHTIDKGYDIFKEAAVGFATKETHGRNFVTDEALAQTYASCHVLLAPTRLDTFGLSQLEALMCNTPVITSPIPEHLALDMPVFYASDVRTIRLKLLAMEREWKRSREDYEARYCYGLRERVLHYDKRAILPKFEAMLRDVVANPS
jgi:glycosyltransferase involved in cell wall biosynthesis